MEINKKDTAVVITDPQNDFLSEKGVTWELVGDSGFYLAPLLLPH
jgi:hypothetical protein